MTRGFVPLSLALLVLACGRDDKAAPGQFPIARDELSQPAQHDDAGELTFRRYCVGCHGMDGRGNGGVTGADLTAADGPLATKPDDALIASVRDGKRGKTGTMPPHKPVLTDAKIAEVIRYTRERFGKPAEPAQPAQPAEPAQPGAR